MIEVAVKIARANKIDKLPRMAAILVYKRKIMAVGLNSRKSHPFQKKFSKNNKSEYLHAENDCIKNALKYYSKEEISNFTLYIARVLKDGNPALAKPCLGCQKAIDEYGIKKVIWTNDQI